MGLSQTLNRFIAPRATRFYISPYNHAVTRYMEHTPHEDNPSTNPQIKEKNFNEKEHIFHLDSTNKKVDNIIACALTNSGAYEPFFKNFNHFALTFYFFTSKKRDMHYSHEIILKTKLILSYTYYKFKPKHYIFNSLARNSHHRFFLINSKYTSTYFWNFTPIALNILTCTASSVIMIRSGRCIYFAH